MKLKIPQFDGRPPGLAEAVHLLNTDQGWERFMVTVMKRAPDAVEVRDLIREVIAVVCRKFDPAAGDLWKFVSWTAYLVGQNLERPEKRRAAKTGPLLDGEEVIDPHWESFFQHLLANTGNTPELADLRKGWRHLTLAEGYVLFLRQILEYSQSEIEQLGGLPGTRNTVGAQRWCRKVALRKLGEAMAPPPVRGDCTKHGKPAPDRGRGGRRPRGAPRSKA